jgi:chorismate lyase/3-hydroxybenzoate synthase
MPAAVAAPTTLPFAVEFGRPVTMAMPVARGRGLELHLPLLGGEAREDLFPPAAAQPDDAGLHLFTSAGLLLGCVTEPVTDEHTLSFQTQSLYRRVLAATRGHHLYRFWNYVPRINALTGGFENYRAFCQGRSLAFEAGAGAGFPQVLPAASGVGTADGCLSLVFAAGTTPPRHFENPEQIPAYRYPSEYGPRSPSFSRATVAVLPDRTFTFISGTAAIKGHHTVAPDTLAAQLDCTLDNLRLISSATGLGDQLGAGRGARRHFKVYLRHAADLAATRTRLESALLQPGDHVSYLQADICRAALTVEIEATLVS